MKDNSPYDTQLNDIQYVYKVIIFNNDGRSISLSQDVIKLLVIHDKIISPFAEGYMIIDNKLNAIQRGYNNGEEDVEAAFDFNLSNNDYVYVEITPKFYDNQTKDDINDNVWTLKHTFAIYDTEDIPSETPDDKFKKLYLWDIDKMTMLEKTSDFSTGNYTSSDIPKYQMDDEDRMMSTGNIIKQLITNSNKSPEFDSIWDEGSNQMFYTSPTNKTYFDDLKYIYEIHQSSVTNDFSILSKNRYTDVWKLEKFSDIMGKSLNQNDKTKSGDYQLEAFIIAEGGESEKIPFAKRVPTDYGYERNIFFGDQSKLEDYRLIEISKLDAAEAMKTVVAHSYDHNEGKFRVEHYDLKDTVSFYESNYSDKLKFGQLLNSSTLLVDENRLNNVNLNHLYIPLYNTENTLEFCSRNNVLKSAYTLNIALEFSVTGFPHRESGKFFSVQKENRYVNSEFESKLQGQWFCVSVDHVFSENTYTNNVVGVKLNKLENNS
jgi:hypothetical protein